MNKTKVAVDIFNNRAVDYQNKFMDVSLYADTFNLFCNSITTQDTTILELACGPGNVTKYLLSKRPDLKLIGTDLAPNMLELAKINNPTAEFQLMDARNLSTLNKKFDALMMGFCLPYLTKEEAIKIIGDSHKILNPNGVLYISTMEDDYEKSGLKTGSKGDTMFIHYHEAEYLLNSIKDSGYTIIDIQRKKYPEQDGNITTDLIIIAKK